MKWEYESQHPEPHTNVDLNHSKTDCHPQIPASAGVGSCSPFPTALQTPKTSRSTSETPMANSRGSRWGFRTKQGYPAHGMSKHHQSLGSPWSLDLAEWLRLYFRARALLCERKSDWWPPWSHRSQSLRAWCLHTSGRVQNPGAHQSVPATLGLAERRDAPMLWAPTGAGVLSREGRALPIPRVTSEKEETGTLRVAPGCYPVHSQLCTAWRQNSPLRLAALRPPRNRQLGHRDRPT